MRLGREIAVIVAAALLPAGAAAVWHPKRAAWRSGEIAVGAAMALGERVLWVDARPSAEVRAGSLPGALPLNEEAWDTLVPGVLEIWTPERTIVVFCGSAACGASREVARRLRDEAGLPEVYALEGGWEALARERR